MPSPGTRPLAGRRVVVTRAAEQAGTLVALLCERGAEPVVVPAITVAEPDDGGAALRAAAARLRDGAYDWVVLASANAAHRWAAAVRAASGADHAGAAEPDRIPPIVSIPRRAPRIAAIGPGTGAALAEHGVEPDLVPDDHVAEGLVESFPRAGAHGGRVLLPQAARARDVLAEGLRAKGWDVDVAVAYRTVAAPPPTAEQRAAVRAADAITFTSSSTVRSWVAVAGADAVPPVVACIGPVTAATARELGLTVAVVPATHTVPALVAALADHFGAR